MTETLRVWDYGVRIKTIEMPGDIVPNALDDPLEVLHATCRALELRLDTAPQEHPMLIGTLVVRKRLGHLVKLTVEPQFRRQGMASLMWHMAGYLGWQPQHSASRSDEGDAWARFITPDVAPRQERLIEGPDGDFMPDPDFVPETA